MHEIETESPSPEFFQCWQAAGEHLQSRAEGTELKWLKSRLEPPFLEHLSFSMGNQLFFVRIEEQAQQLTVPGSETGWLTISKECRGHACLMPMTRGSGAWVPVHPGWGLISSVTGERLVPPNMTTDEPVEMTDWELQDFAVQVVRDTLRNEGREIMSSQGNPNVDPSLWFVGGQGPEWVVVRAVRYPEKEAQLPDNWTCIEDSCSKVSRKGHFASVAMASADDQFKSDSPPVPLWRGRGMYVSFSGITSPP